MFPLASMAFVGGLITGSFLSVVAHRVPEGRSIVGPRSQCLSCGHTIAAYDNVPVLSWLVLRGRCRSCRARIPAVYPLLEAGLGLAFAATTVVLLDDPAELAMGLVLVATLAAITVTDLQRRIIPNKVLIAALAIGLGLTIATDPASLPERGIGLAGGGGFLLVALLAYPRGMGMGDVKLAGVMGFFLGASIAPALMSALLVGAVVGVGLMLSEGSGARKKAIPFGPFLALGGLLGLLAGPEIIDWYLNSFVRQ